MAVTRFGMLGCAFIGLIVVSSCNDIDAPAIPRINLALLTPKAAQGVDANGMFVLRAEGSGEISADQARTLASAFWRDLGSTFEAVVMQDRGGAVHTTQLVPCARSYYVESAYTAVPAEMPSDVIKALGPEWLVGMCYGVTEEAVIAVSAMATDATASGGHLTDAGGQGNFFLMGVPVGAEIPAAPESVATVAATSSAKRVSTVPSLTMKAFPAAPTTAVWHISIEAPALATGATSHSTQSLQAFAAGALNGWGSIAFAAANPDSANGQSETIQIQDITGANTSFMVTRRADVPKYLELISFGGR